MLVTFGPFRGLALRHAGSKGILNCLFFGQIIFVNSDFFSNTSREKKRCFSYFSRGRFENKLRTDRVWSFPNCSFKTSRRKTKLRRHVKTSTNQYDAIPSHFKRYQSKIIVTANNPLLANGCRVSCRYAHSRLHRAGPKPAFFSSLQP